MKKAKGKILLALVCCAGGFLIFWSMTNDSLPDEDRLTWDDPGAIFQGDATWAAMEPILRQMPPLPPDVEGVHLMGDNTVVPRSYFDKPPILRRFFPPENAPADE
ncbi:hypothetical protein [Candidatus Foliamicus sp.]